MMRKLTHFQKIKIAAASLVVFLLVLATNIMDNNHFDIVQQSLETVLDDRLVAKDYIYKISRQIHLKNKLLYTSDHEQMAKANQKANDSIQTLVAKYAATELTPKEAQYFESLENNLDKLLQVEKQLYGKSPSEQVAAIEKAETYFTRIGSNLDVLSEVQLAEGKRQIHYSNRAIENSNLIAKLEIGALIVIGLIIQIFIFFKPSE
ncbi:MAG: MCP four helix bundle domain-containing protein [Imperialibacter sp.]|uniref:MCP four helix bundle domain-containing protein n=1 Tax=Imperialibacter sp. TaxID=2038411 RepID=UPI0030D7BEC8|tara:strand:+ start:889 stop:1506 length:618 start_codon:yes stop_codon:yes gene_type:complete